MAAIWATLVPYMPDLRPGNRGIGVSVAVEHSQCRMGIRVVREVSQPLPVWDAAARSDTTLHPGAVLCSWQIHRSAGVEAEAYLMEFHSAGRLYTCPLYLFQPRTRVIDHTALAS